MSPIRTMMAQQRRQPASLSRQAGMGFFGLIFFVAVVGGLGFIGLKAFPIYAEYLKISRVVKKVAAEGAKTEPEIQASFDRAAAIEDIQSVKGSDLIIDTKRTKPSISFSYSKKLPLIPPVSLVFDFEGSGI